MLTYCPITSGSKGNCHFAATAKTAVLIDAGGSAKGIKSSACLSGYCSAEAGRNIDNSRAYRPYSRAGRIMQEL